MIVNFYTTLKILSFVIIGGHRHTGIFVDALTAQHLKISGARRFGRPAIRECTAQAFTGGRLLHDAIADCRRGVMGNLQKSRGDVADKGKLTASGTPLRDIARPVHDRAITDATQMRRHILHPLKGRIERPAPLAGIL